MRPRILAAGLVAGLAAAGGALTACSADATTKPCYTVQDARRHTIRPCHPTLPTTRPTTAPTTPATTAVPTTAPTTATTAVPTTPATTTTAPTTEPTETVTQGPVQPWGPVSPTGAWDVVLADDFDTLNLDAWVVQDGRDMNGVHSRGGNVSVTGGKLRLALSQESGTTYGAMVGTNLDYWPDESRYVMKPGDVIEASIFFPGSATQEVVNWGGFWTSGPDWPTNGENDIFEGGPDVSINYHGVDSVAGNDLDHYVSNGSPSSGAGTWGGRWVRVSLYRTFQHTSEIRYDGQLVRTIDTYDHEGDAGQVPLFSLGVSDQSAPVFGDDGALMVDWFRAYRPA